MANFRQIHVSIWKDPWFLELDANEKLLFIYLFSNESTSLAGIYEIAFRVICFETNLDAEFVKITLKKFEEANKVIFKDGIVWVKNLRKYNSSTSPKVVTRLEKDLQEIPECPIKQEYISYYNNNIPHIYHTNTISYEEEEVMNVNNECNGNKVVEEYNPDNPYRKLFDAFLEQSGIKETLINIPKANRSIDNWIKAGVTEDQVKRAIIELQDKEFAITGPWSIDNAINIILSRDGSGVRRKKKKKYREVMVDGNLQFEEIENDES